MKTKPLVETIKSDSYSNLVFDFIFWFAKKKKCTLYKNIYSISNELKLEINRKFVDIHIITWRTIYVHSR